jgi:hypothetical protein
MLDSKKKILEMMAEKKITADEALRLLDALDTGSSAPSKPEGGEQVKTKPKYLRVTVTPGENGTIGHGNLFQDGNVGRVNVRVPMSLIRAGVKLTSLIPPDAVDKANNALREKGINFDIRSIKPENLDEIVDALGDMEVDIEGKPGEKVRVFVE